MKLILVGHSARRLAVVGAALFLGVSSLATTACSDEEPVADVGGGGAVAPGGAPNSTGGRAPTGGDENVGGDGGAASGGSGTGGQPEFREKTAAELAVTSAPDYDDNAYGVISGKTLAAYQANWAENKPAGVEGRLIVLKITPNTQTSSVVVRRDNEAGVYSYILPANDVAQARSNGLSAFETDIPDGPRADALLKKYGLDPTRDFLVLTFEAQAATGDTGRALVQSVGRAWVFFSYWGWPKERLGILNGSIEKAASLEGLKLALVADQEGEGPDQGFNFNAPNDGTKSFRDLYVDQTILSISLEELIATLKQEEDAPHDLSQVRIVDARGGAEALGLKKATNVNRPPSSATAASPAPYAVCPSWTGTAPNARCSTPFEGRIKGARSVPWTGYLQDETTGFKFLAPAALKAKFDLESGWVDGTHELTIQYCRTNQRSTVTGIVAAVILGYPTRFYETSFIEWAYLAARGDGDTATYPKANTLAANSPFRTDLAELTEHAVLDDADAGAYTPGGSLGALTQPVTWVAGPNYNDEADISPPVENEWPKLSPEGTSTRVSIEEDRAYLRDR